MVIFHGYVKLPEGINLSIHLSICLHIESERDLYLCVCMYVWVMYFQSIKREKERDIKEIITCGVS